MGWLENIAGGSRKVVKKAQQLSKSYSEYQEKSEARKMKQLKSRAKQLRAEEKMMRLEDSIERMEMRRAKRAKKRQGEFDFGF